MPSKRAMIAYLRFNAVVIALVSALLYAVQHPMEAFLYAAAGLCAAAMIGLFWLAGKIESDRADLLIPSNPHHY